MDLKQLTTFVCVSELGSLSRASDKLRIAQPALSRQIRMLEDELQIALFERHGRGMVLTDAGTLLLPKAKSILRQIEDARTDLIDQNNIVRGRVSLGVPPTVGDVLAARLVEKFHLRYPEVKIRVVPAFSGYLLDFLHRGDIDLAIMYAIKKQDNLYVKSLIKEDLVLVGPGNAGLRLSEPKEFRDLASTSLILPSGNHGLRVLISRYAQRSRINLQVSIEADALQTLKDLVIRGLGYTILPLVSVQSEAKSGELSVSPIIKPTLSRQLILARPVGKSITTATRLFAEILVDEFAKNGSKFGLNIDND